MDKKLGVTLAAFVVFLITVGALAYNNSIPKEIKEIPFYDSIGHFVLFGFLGLIAHYAFRRKRIPLFGRNVPLGPTLAVAYAFFDESLQVFSSNRSFDLGDLFFGVLGIFSFISIASFVRNYRLRSNLHV